MPLNWLVLQGYDVDKKESNALSRGGILDNGPFGGGGGGAKEEGYCKEKCYFILKLNLVL